MSSPNPTSRVFYPASRARRSPSCTRLGVAFVPPTASSCSPTDFCGPRVTFFLRKRDLWFTQRNVFLALPTRRVWRRTDFSRLSHFFHRAPSKSALRSAVRFHFRLRSVRQRTVYERPRTFLHRQGPVWSLRRPSRPCTTRFSMLQSPRASRRCGVGLRLRPGAPRSRHVSSSQPRFVVYGWPTCWMRRPCRSMSRPALEDSGPAGDSRGPSFVALRP